MAILGALQSAAMRLISRKPGSFFGVDGTFEMEICDLVNEVAQDVAKYQDWQSLTRVAEIVGDGTTEMFDRPADYDRMLVNSEVQDKTSWMWGYYPYTDINAFLYDQTRGFGLWPGGWILYENKLRFSPAPTGTAMYPYISNQWARSSDGATRKAAFDSDMDDFLLSDRLLTLGLVWRWRENKKFDASGDQEAFVKALDEYAGKDKGSRVRRWNSRGSYPGTHPAWPWELGG